MRTLLISLSLIGLALGCDASSATRDDAATDPGGGPLPSFTDPPTADHAPYDLLLDTTTRLVDGSALVPPLVEGPPPDPGDWTRGWTALTDDWEINYGSPRLQVSPDGALIVRQDLYGQGWFRARDGAWLGAERDLQALSMDAPWTRQVVPGVDDRLVLEALPGRAEIMVLDPTGGLPGDWSPAHTPTLAWSSDGQQLVALSCWYVDGGERVTTLTSWDLANGAQVLQVEIDADCRSWSWIDTQPLILSPDGARALFTFEQDPRLHEVSLTTGEHRAHDVLEAPPVADEETLYGGTPVFLDLAIRPDGQELAATLRDGSLRRWRLSDLSPVGEPIPAAVVAINEYTYGPSVESPLAWSPDGAFLVHLDATGEAVLTDASSGEPRVVFSRPELERPEHVPEDSFNPATAFHFFDGGRGLLIQHELGLSLWRQDSPSVTPESAPLAVTASADAASATPGQTVTVALQVSPAERLSVRRLLIDGQPTGAATLGDHLSLESWEPGPVFLRVLADDGHQEASSAPVVLVVEEL
jgi:hypothetical protein